MSEAMGAGAAGAATSGSGSATSSGNATATPSAGSSQSPGGNQNPGSSSNSWDGNQQVSQGESQSQGKVGETQAEKVERILGEADMDAIVIQKVNGKEEKMTVREALKRAQLSSASHQKMQEAAKIAKQGQQLIQLAKTNPKEFFKLTGQDPHEFAEATLAEKYEMMQLTPEQKQAMEDRRERDELKAERDERLKRESNDREQQAVQKEMQTLDTDIGEAFRESGLPRDKFFVAQIAAEMLSASKRNIQLTAKEAASKVKGRWESSNRTILEGMDASAIQQLLGPKVLKILADQELKRVTEQSASGFGSNSQFRPDSSASGQGKNSKIMNEFEYRQWLQGSK